MTNVAPKLYAAVCIERMPVLTAEMNDIEKKYSESVNRFDFNISSLSDHELRLIKDKLVH